MMSLVVMAVWPAIALAAAGEVDWLEKTGAVATHGSADYSYSYEDIGPPVTFDDHDEWDLADSGEGPLNISGLAQAHDNSANMREQASGHAERTINATGTSITLATSVTCMFDATQTLWLSYPTTYEDLAAYSYAESNGTLRFELDGDYQFTFSAHLEANTPDPVDSQVAVWLQNADTLQYLFSHTATADCTTLDVHKDVNELLTLPPGTYILGYAADTHSNECSGGPVEETSNLQMSGEFESLGTVPVSSTALAVALGLAALAFRRRLFA